MRNRLGEHQDGAVVVEFAAVFLLFMLLVWGLITYGVIFAVQQSLSHGTSEAARAVVGVTDQDDDGIEDEIVARIGEVLNEQLSWLGGTDAVAVTYDVEFPADDASLCDQCARVTASYDWGGHAIVPAILDVATPDTLTAAAVWEYE